VGAPQGERVTVTPPTALVCDRILGVACHTIAWVWGSRWVCETPRQSWSSVDTLFHTLAPYVNGAPNGVGAAGIVVDGVPAAPLQTECGL